MTVRILNDDEILGGVERQLRKAAGELAQAQAELVAAWVTLTEFRLMKAHNAALEYVVTVTTASAAPASSDEGPPA